VTAAVAEIWHKAQKYTKGKRILRFLCVSLSLCGAGFGFQLLVDVLRLLPVSHVVQLGHGESMQCPMLTPDLLQTATGYHTKPPAHSAMDGFTEGHSPARTYAHLAVQSAFQGVGRQGAW